jgi:hypothetical protein
MRPADALVEWSARSDLLVVGRSSAGQEVALLGGVDPGGAPRGEVPRRRARSREPGEAGPGPARPGPR